MTRLMCVAIAFWVAAGFTAFADVKGTILDKEGEPIVGATVLVKGTQKGAAADLDGNFTLSGVDANATLLVSAVGYTPQEVALKGRTNVTITLVEDSKVLDEVVAVGYGTMDKKELTSAVSHISAEEMLAVSSVDPAMQIQGKVAGVSITNTATGDPNSGASIQIRGVSSRSAGLGPLIVIDGVAGGNLHNISPNDIASIDVLKDGAATAIYGTRGSNGVIVVTTKGGTKDGSVHTDYQG